MLQRSWRPTFVAKKYPKQTDKQKPTHDCKKKCFLCANFLRNIYFNFIIAMMRWEIALFPFLKAGKSKAKWCADKNSCHLTSISAVGISSGLQYLFSFLHLSFCGIIQCVDKVAWEETAEAPWLQKVTCKKPVMELFLLLFSYPPSAT